MLIEVCISSRLPIQPESAVRSTLQRENSESAAERKWKKAKFKTNTDGKLPLIAFGNGMFGKDNAPIKGYRSDLVNVLYRMLKRREARGELVVVTIDEYLTSQVTANAKYISHIAPF